MKTPNEVANALKKIYESTFGGKDRGRYQISRQSLRELSERGRLEDSTVDAIVSEAYELGFVVTDLGDDFSVVEVDVMRSYRKVPVRVISEHA
jgi:hypothetical protein